MNNLWTFKFPEDAVLSKNFQHGTNKVACITTHPIYANCSIIEMEICANSFTEALDVLNSYIIFKDQPAKPAAEDLQHLLQVNRTLKNILTTLIDSSTLHWMAHDSRGVNSDDYVKSVDELHGTVLDAVVQMLKHISAMPPK